MDSKEITRRLIVGSEAIDQMRREIDLVVYGIMGMMMKKHEVNSWHGEFSKKLRQERFFSPEFPGCEWLLRVTGLEFPFEVGCYLNIGLGQVSAYSSFRVRGSRSSDIISFNHVQRVHESLPLFVDGIKKTFSFLEDCWQPFSDAADYAEKNGW